MKNLKVIKNNELKDWAEEIFKKNSFNMVDVSTKKETHRRALASGKIYVGKEVFNLIKNGEEVTEIVLLDPMGHSQILHENAKNWDLSDEEISSLEVGPQIPIMDSSDLTE